MVYSEVLNFEFRYEYDLIDDFKFPENKDLWLGLRYGRLIMAEALVVNVTIPSTIIAVFR